MEMVYYICFTAFACIGTYYFGVSDGIKIGVHRTFIAYVQELTEIKLRVSESAWKELADAMVVINDRKLRQNNKKDK